MWLSIFKGLIQLADVVSKTLHDKQLIKAGEAKALHDQLLNIHTRIILANEARFNSTNDSKSGGLLEDDGFKRD